MKQKDIVYLLLAVVILLGGGYLGYTQLMPKQDKDKAVKVEVVGVIPENFDEQAMTQLNNAEEVVDFNSPVDLSGLGNPKPFGGQ
jgi:hypothetical protein